MPKDIHSTAIINPSVKLPAPLTIGAYTRIDSGVHLGAGSVVSDFCLLGGGAEAARSGLLVGIAVSSKGEPSVSHK
jgi:acyl-[acyl carrier protein]--UDP-N-acetylglucosamine O-acyltransferase